MTQRMWRTRVMTTFSWGSDQIWRRKKTNGGAKRGWEWSSAIPSLSPCMTCGHRPRVWASLLGSDAGCYVGNPWPGSWRSRSDAAICMMTWLVTILSLVGLTEAQMQRRVAFCDHGCDWNDIMREANEQTAREWHQVMVRILNWYAVAVMTKSKCLKPDHLFRESS